MLQTSHSATAIENNLSPFSLFGRVSPGAALKQDAVAGAGFRRKALVKASSATATTVSETRAVLPQRHHHAAGGVGVGAAQQHHRLPRDRSYPAAPAAHLRGDVLGERRAGVLLSRAITCSGGRPAISPLTTESPVTRKVIDPWLEIGRERITDGASSAAGAGLSPMTIMLKSGCTTTGEVSSMTSPGRPWPCRSRRRAAAAGRKAFGRGRREPSARRPGPLVSTPNRSPQPPGGFLEKLLQRRHAAIVLLDNDTLGVFSRQ